MTQVQESDNIELKETYDRNRFLQLLQGWAQAIEQQREFEFIIDGETRVIPANAVDTGKLRVEYEIEKGEHEFELTLKWR